MKHAMIVTSLLCSLFLPSRAGWMQRTWRSGNERAIVSRLVRSDRNVDGLRKSKSPQSSGKQPSKRICPSKWKTLRNWSWKMRRLLRSDVGWAITSYGQNTPPTRKCLKTQYFGQL